MHRAEEHFSTQMVTSIQENLLWIGLMGMELIFTQMEQDMRGPGKMIFKMATESKNSRMAQDMTGNSLLERRRDKVF